jgi:hypothetical protein
MPEAEVLISSSEDCCLAGKIQVDVVPHGKSRLPEADAHRDWSNGREHGMKALTACYVWMGELTIEEC